MRVCTDLFVQILNMIQIFSDVFIFFYSRERMRQFTPFCAPGFEKLKSCSFYLFVLFVGLFLFLVLSHISFLVVLLSFFIIYNNHTQLIVIYKMYYLLAVFLFMKGIFIPFKSWKTAVQLKDLTGILFFSYSRVFFASEKG